MLGNIGPWQLLIIFLIVLLIFGTKKLRNVGGDLGKAIRDFRKGVGGSDDSEDSDEESNKGAADATTEQSTSAESPGSESSGSDSFRAKPSSAESSSGNGGDSKS